MIKDIKFDATSTMNVCKWFDKSKQYVVSEDILAQEVPISFVYNGISHAVMLATACDISDFAVGFSLSEGIVSSIAQIYDLEIFNEIKGIRVELTIASECLFQLKLRRRALLGRTGCGLCGTQSLDHALILPTRLTSKTALTAHQICSGFVQMEMQQKIRQKTGATHAAAFMDKKENILLVREDVGRHNALDKLIGALFVNQVDVSQGAVLVSSRASYEMVQKCASAGIPALAAASAATQLAVDIAQKTGLFLLGHARADRHTIYSSILQD